MRVSLCSRVATGLLAFLAAVPHLVCAAAPDFVDVFVSGRDGYPNYRIPSLVVTKRGTVLALCEGRARHNDHASNDLVLKRSTDGGTTWSPLQRLRDEGEATCNDPVMLELDTGRLLLFYARFPAEAHTLDVVPGFEGAVSRHFTMYSDDDGRTWSEPHDITRQVKPVDAQATSQGAGGGVQLRGGRFAGRILIPLWQRKVLSAPPPGERQRVSDGVTAIQQAFVAISDDRGKTWRHSAIVPDGESPLSQGGRHNMSEGALLERSDGTVVMNGRTSNGPRPMFRKISISGDGGETWSRCELERSLPEPGCQATLLRYSNVANGRALFANPNSQEGRSNGYVRLSYDEGRTWPVGKQLVSGIYRYSSLARLPDGRIGLLFEQGPGRTPTITLARFSLEWLTDGEEQRH